MNMLRRDRIFPCRSFLQGFCWLINPGLLEVHCLVIDLFRNVLWEVRASEFDRVAVEAQMVPSLQDFGFREWSSGCYIVDSVPALHCESGCTLV